MVGCAGDMESFDIETTGTASVACVMLILVIFQVILYPCALQYLKLCGSRYNKIVYVIRNMITHEIIAN